MDFSSHTLISEKGDRKTLIDFPKTLHLLHQYTPASRAPASGMSQLGTHRYEHLETALVEILSEHHTSIEVELIFKHFQGKGSTPVAK